MMQGSYTNKACSSWSCKITSRPEEVQVNPTEGNATCTNIGSLFTSESNGEETIYINYPFHRNGTKPALSVGDVVLISEDNVSRGKWPMGRAEKFFPKKDALVHTTELKTQKKKP